MADCDWDSCGTTAMLGDDHFETYRKEHPKMLAFFFAPWCGHCTSTKPEFAAASTKVGRSLPFVAVDCDGDGEGTCKTFNVTSFPAIKYIDGEHVEDLDSRSSGDFLTFAEKKLNDAATGADGKVNFKVRAVHASTPNIRVRTPHFHPCLPLPRNCV
jgi:thiol-disulfide isomerase/thioredoxin